MSLTVQKLNCCILLLCLLICTSRADEHSHVVSSQQHVIFGLLKGLFEEVPCIHCFVQGGVFLVLCNNATRALASLYALYIQLFTCGALDEFSGN